MILRELGRGFHGKVKLCVDMETGKEWALKIVQKKARPRFQSRLHSHRMVAVDGQGQASPSNPELEKIKREIAILKKCSHPHVVALNEVIDDPAAEKIYLVLEYLAGGDIRWHDQSDPPEPVLTIDEARRIFRDVVCGVEYLHYQGIVHRDIKPANLLWTADGRVKISDFGVSVVIQPSLPPGEVSADLERHHEIELAKTVGTPAFFAPEMCGLPDDDLVLLQHDEPDSISRQSSITKNPIDEVPSVGETSSADSESSANVGAPSRSDTASDEREQASSVGNAATGIIKPIPLLIPARDDDASIINGTPGLPPLVLSPVADETFLQPVEHNQLPIGKAIDIWAMGVTLYCFVFGRVPFMAETEFELFNVISRKPIEFPDEIPIDDNLRDLFMRLLDKDPTTRITLEEIKLHPWATADLNSEERDAWLQETDPTLYGGPVEVTEEDVRGAVSAMSRLRERIRKLSSSFQNLTAGLRRRTKSVPSVPGEITMPVDSLFDRKDAIRRERRCSPLSGGESSCESLNGKLGLGSPPHHFSDTTSPDPSVGTSTHTHTRESSGGEWIRWGIVRNESFNSAPPEACRRLMSPMTHPVGGADIMEEMDIHNDNIIEGPEQEVMRLREFQLTYAKQSCDSLIYSDGEDADEGLTLSVPSGELTHNDEAGTLQLAEGPKAKFPVCIF
ncbi:hypothetical protein HDU85_007206 [Gaertneriomyces sp. JEL0708]|nr:hypothetical protein HDU85_007206 [Gaertneriomyces sp. JEL0708]